MPSNYAVALAYKYAENRIVYYLSQVFAKLRTKYIENGYVPFSTVNSDIKQAIISGLSTSYIYGRVGAAGDISKRTGILVTNREFTDWLSHSVVFEIIMKYDREMLPYLAGKYLYNAMTDRKGAMEAYFRPSQKALEFLDGYSLELAGIESKDFLDKATSLTRKTIEEGMSHMQASKFLKENLKNFSMIRTRAIARSEATRAFNIGTLEESFTDDIVTGYEFNSVLDGLTTVTCRERNGKFIPKDDIQTLLNNTPPLHVNCRSRLEVVTKYDKKKMKLLRHVAEEHTARIRDMDREVLRKILAA